VRLDDLLAGIVSDCSIEASRAGVRWYLMRQVSHDSRDADCSAARREHHPHAIRYAPPQTPVEVHLGRTAPRRGFSARLWARCAEESLSHIFDAFLPVEGDRKPGDGVLSGPGHARRARGTAQGNFCTPGMPSGSFGEMDLPILEGSPLLELLQDFHVGRQGKQLSMSLD